MSKYKFIKQPIDNKFDAMEVTMETEQIVLSDLLEDIELFLKGCGFYFEGHLEIVEDE